MKIRKRSPVAYIFGLVAVVDAPLVRVDYAVDGPATAEHIEGDRYIGSYIINQKEITARIHFVNAKSLPGLIAQYDRLHTGNGTLVSGLIEQFYDGVLLDEERASILDDRFNRLVGFRLNSVLSEAQGPYKSRTYRARMMKNGCVEVSGADDLEEVSILTSTDSAKSVVSRALEDIYKYHGTWKFESDIPF